MNHEYFMDIAIEEAKIAYTLNEVPIGCAIRYNDEVIARAHNMRNTGKNALYHAEIVAIDMACKHIGDWRLEDCHMYVTVEPCPMCAGAIVQARMKSITFGAKNKKAGSCGSVMNLLDNEGFNHRVIINESVRQAECAELMSNFFANLRNGAQ
ncbi:MAG: nucleoside deaminase [Clostridiales bacterium]|jgi:tRNA(adenine34) deaminase|nr:nucleoside deaminase [Clostridiales bacterium]